MRLARVLDEFHLTFKHSSAAVLIIAERFELTCRPPYLRVCTDLSVKPHSFSGQVKRLVSPLPFAANKSDNRERKALTDHLNLSAELFC